MKFGLGTVQFGTNYGIANSRGQVPLEEARAILGHAFRNGINTLDTAAAYGESEERLGEIGVADWQIVSKLPPVNPHCYDILQSVETTVAGSLQRLNVRSLYGLLLHRPLQLLEQYGDRLYFALQEVKHRGLARKIGISIYDPLELEVLSKRYHFDIVQAPLNPVDRRLIDSGWMFRLFEENTELHVRSIFLQGLLLMGADQRPVKFARWSSIWDRWDGWLKAENISSVEACVSFALSFEEISKVIIGVDSLRQLGEILEAAQRTIPHYPDGFKSCDQDLVNPAKWNIES